MMQTEDLIVRLDGPTKLDIEIKFDWLLISKRAKHCLQVVCMRNMTER